ncbi:unnamed protein product [Adineta ricciae]|uniref:Nuclear receptor domain-containing protein n=1 Tax=Adineta ricciae TaxID=249248 RepID=A0A814X3J0_ADIRI|nr:unnamed protein product [Adineta ricciae]
MNSNSSDMHPSMIEIDDDDEKSKNSSSNSDQYEDLNAANSQSRAHISRSSVTSSSSASLSNGGTKRQKDISPCYVCGAKAHGYNFDQITCESCKAFFRRNALKAMDKFRCRNNNNCVITSTTRKRCKRCRLTKCFTVGMRKEWILTDEEKRLKRRKIERNRLIKQQAHMTIQQPANRDINHTNFQTNLPPTEQSSSSSSSHPMSSKHGEPCLLSLPMMHMHRPFDQQLYERQQCLLANLAHGYQMICQQYPQPHKFAYRNALIAQTINTESKLLLVKDLTRELTQMTTSRLLYYFSLIPEFQLLTEIEKKSILIKNMLAVFMFHGALTYNADTDTFVDRTTADQPYDAKYILFVYGPRVYKHFIALATKLTSVTYQLPYDKEADERAHTLFLLLMIVLLFSDGFEAGFNIASYEQGQQKAMEQDSYKTTSDSPASSPSSSLASTTSSSSISKLNEKLHRIQQSYVELACRYLHDAFGLKVGRRMFQNLVPLLFDLQKLCSTLANVNLCELVEDDDRSSSSRTTTVPSIEPVTSEHSATQLPSTHFNSTMISETSHLNELQKENRAPPLSPTLHSTSASTSVRSPLASNSLSGSPASSSTSTTILSNAIPTNENY